MVTMPARSDHAARLPSITGLRFIAAFGVFAYHILPISPQWRWLHPLMMSGQAGVSFFFVLSGFVLTWSYRPGDRARPFWQRRMARILPNQIVTWAIGIPVSAARFGALPHFWPLLTTLTLTQAWVPDHAAYFGVNGVAWSLSCEALFYALFPLLIGPVLRASRRGRVATMLGCVLALAAVQLGSWFSVGYAVGDAARDAFWWVSVLPVSRLPEFVFGMVAAAALRERSTFEVPLLPAALGTLGSLYLAGMFPIVTIAGWLTIVPFGVLICAAAQSDRTGRSGMLATRWAVRLGEWSFAFYMTHQLVLRMVDRAWPLKGWSGLQIGLDLGLAVLAAALLYRFVEVPAERRLRPRQRAVAAPEPVSVVAGRGSAASA